jgi:hypothetical protein
MLNYAPMVFVGVLLLGCGNNPDQQKTTSFMKNAAGLKLYMELPAEPIYLNHPLMIKVTLANEGGQAVIINKRLAPGYEQTLSRELFADMVSDENGEKAAYHEVDINRDFSHPEDYKQLAPGESLTVAFNVFDYYQLTQPGKYRLTLYYQADESLATTPEGIFSGKVSSRPVTLEVLPGMLPGKD